MPESNDVIKRVKRRLRTLLNKPAPVPKKKVKRKFQPDFSQHRCTGTPPQNYRFLFIMGASGSGTTMLTRILNAPEGVVGIGGKHRSIAKNDQPAYRLTTYHNRVNDLLWDRYGSREQYTWAKQESLCVIDQLLQLENYRHVSHILYKRSSPFLHGDRHRPDVTDLFEMFTDVKLILIYRDPRASTYSSFRRDFVPTLRQAAVITDEQLTYMAAQLQTLPPESYLILHYSEFCSEPTRFIKPLAEFTGIDEAGLLQAAEQEQVVTGRDDRWRSECSAEDAAFLDSYFNERRLNQWRLLHTMNV